MAVSHGTKLVRFWREFGLMELTSAIIPPQYKKDPWLCSGSTQIKVKAQLYIQEKRIYFTVDGTADYGLCTYRSYFQSISANIELRVYSVTRCYAYFLLLVNKKSHHIFWILWNFVVFSIMMVVTAECFFNFSCYAKTSLCSHVFSIFYFLNITLK
jgi:hypothetical protein